MINKASNYLALKSLTCYPAAEYLSVWALHGWHVPRFFARALKKCNVSGWACWQSRIKVKFVFSFVFSLLFFSLVSSHLFINEISFESYSWCHSCESPTKVSSTNFFFSFSVARRVEVRKNFEAALECRHERLIYRKGAKHGPFNYEFVARKAKRMNEIKRELDVETKRHIY